MNLPRTVKNIYTKDMTKRRGRLATIIVLLIIIAAIGSAVVYSRLLSHLSNSTSDHTNTTQPKTPQESALTCVQALPLEVQIGQKIMAAGYNDQLSSLHRTFLQYGLGGVIIMDQTPAADITTFSNGFEIPPTVAVDQEGGTVQRYTSEGLLPGATEMAAEYTPSQAYDKYYADALYLKSQGITVNFGPVLGVMSVSPSALPGRMYSSDPSVVVQYATQFIKASFKAGVIPVVKHFPGLGSTTTNTDNGSATTDPLSVLEGRDLIPYQKLSAYKPDAMVSNAIVPGLTNGQPAIWSPAAVSLLRSEGYQDSVVYTDSLTAAAVPGSIEDAAIKAWQAGNDVALIVQKPQDAATLPSTIGAVVSKTTAALNDGELNKNTFEASVARILASKHINPCTIAKNSH